MGRVTVTSSDVDHFATAAYSGDTTGTYGSFAVNASTGVWTYTLDNANHQNLAAGESHDETFTVKVGNANGSTPVPDRVGTATCAYDAPVITSAAQSGTVKEDTTLISFNDTATTEIYTLSLHDALPICTGTYGSFAVNASTGVWTYTLDNANHQNLAAGESHDETFTV